jgi:hypothetical protein
MNGIDSTPPAAAIAAVTSPPAIGLWRFFCALLPSFLLGAFLIQTFPAVESYPLGFGFLFAVACGLAFLGWKTNIRRQVNQAVVLLWLAPLLPLIVGVIVDEVAYTFWTKDLNPGH